MDKEQVFTVKIYFVTPLDLISVIVNTLIELEYESYAIGEADSDYLDRILPDNNRNVVFICIRNRMEVENWLKYAEKLSQIKETQVLIGAFVYDNMEDETKNKFLSQNISVIEFSDIKKNTLSVIKNILVYFEAKGQRGYIRTKAYGTSEAYFYVKGRENPILAKVVDISAFAFSAEVDEMEKLYFTKNTYFSEVLFVLGGIRVRSAVKVLGFNKNQANIFVLRFCTAKMSGGKIVYEETVNPDTKRKLHDYIRKCLKDELDIKLNSFRERPSQSKVVKEESSDK